MRRFQQLSFCLVTILAVSLTGFSGCDLGTYSKRSTEYLEANPGGVKKAMKKEEMNKEETRAIKRTLPLMVEHSSYFYS